MARSEILVCDLGGETSLQAEVVVVEVTVAGGKVWRAELCESCRKSLDELLASFPDGYKARRGPVQPRRQRIERKVFDSPEEALRAERRSGR